MAKTALLADQINEEVIPFATLVSTYKCACIDETPGISGT